MISRHLCHLVLLAYALAAVSLVLLLVTHVHILSFRFPVSVHVYTLDSILTVLFIPKTA